jgi:hypothetical protein
MTTGQNKEETTKDTTKTRKINEFRLLTPVMQYQQI